MVASNYQPKPDIVALIENLDNACIRFVHFSRDQELRSRVSERLIRSQICKKTNPKQQQQTTTNKQTTCMSRQTYNVFIEDVDGTKMFVNIVQIV